MKVLGTPCMSNVVLPVLEISSDELNGDNAPWQSQHYMYMYYNTKSVGNFFVEK